VALSKNANTNIVISPLAGLQLNRAEIGIRFFALPALPGILETTFLQKGGYGYLGLDFSYYLSKK
jgi:hypothetical protein